MKKYQLCAGCEEYFSCQETCQAAKDFEQEDNTQNYEKTAYKPKGMSNTWNEQKRMNGGINSFK